MREARPLDEPYIAALRDYLAGGGEEPLKRAYEIGRTAMADGLGVLEMLALNHRALLSILEGKPQSGECGRMIQAAEVFFAESLSPFEMAHRGFREAHTALRHLNETLEEEAKRIAHALHDEAGQLLVSVYLSLDSLDAEIPQARPRLQEVRGLLHQMEEQLRRLSHELRPTILDDLGLLPALEFLADGIAKRTGLPIEVGGSTHGRLPPVVETALYRIVQEALTNAVRHADAARVRVELQREPQAIRCSIADDGVGFDAPTVLAHRGGPGLGLVGIRERLEAVRGSVQIISAPGQGTRLHVAIPLET